MDQRYRNELLREAARDPRVLVSRKKFWRPELWQHYLRRCDDLVFQDPHTGLRFSQQAPELAAKIAKHNPGVVNGPDLLLLAFANLGSAYRRVNDYERAEALFLRAGEFTNRASTKAYAEYLRRLAYLRLYKKDPECFEIIGEAIDIHKRGNLVNRHALGECLICRARAYVMFEQHGKSFDDYTAALNHVSIRNDPKPYYCTLHCLALWVVLYGNDDQLESAAENLRAAHRLLRTWWGSPYPKIKLRWLLALFDARLEALGAAEEGFLDVRKGLIEMKLPYELGAVSIDLGSLYVRMGQANKLQRLLTATTEDFKRIGAGDQAAELLNQWRKIALADHSDDLLQGLRQQFLDRAGPMPSIAA